MALGVDTGDTLTGIDWSTFHSWKKAWPTFAGRYFGGYGVDLYQEGEFKYAYTSTHEALTYAFAIQGAQGGGSYKGQTYYSTEGTLGYSYGKNDAMLTCENVAAALTNDELKLPSGGLVVVYLDVEKNDDLKSAYWAGWANTVHTYGVTLNGTTLRPFVPGIYCPYWTSSTGAMLPATSVQTVFDNAYKYWTNSNVRCRGLWTNEPVAKAFCTAGANVSSYWSQFGTSKQTLQSGTVDVPLLLWQYAESGICQSWGYTSFAGGQWLDLDGSDSTNAETYMFTING